MFACEKEGVLEQHMQEANHHVGKCEDLGGATTSPRARADSMDHMVEGDAVSDSAVQPRGHARRRHAVAARRRERAGAVPHPAHVRWTR